MSRPENKENLRSLADQLVWGLEEYIGTGVENIPQSMGTLYYVSNVNGSDSNDGLSPDNAKATIGGAITACSAGDIIIIEAGTYPEDVDVNKNSVELWFEIGAIINAQLGTGLTISGNYCKVITPGGALRINPIANGTGCLLSGQWAYVHDIRIPSESSGDIGFDITGHGAVLNRCRAGKPLIAGYKLQANGIHVIESVTRGLAADTSIGYWITNSCEGVVLRDCGSKGHASGGYVVDAGVTCGEAINCVSGGGDGPRLDPEHAVVWSNFTYDNIVFKDITFAGIPTTYNIFKVTGTVRVSDIYGVVETQIENVASTLYLQLFSAGGTADITNAPGTNIQAAVVGSALVRNEDSTNAIALASAATPAIIESTNWRDPKVPVDIIADYDQTTYIRLVISAALASGEIHWHCKYEQLSDGGFVEPA